MNCSDIRERMMDVLYGEMLDSRACFEFFRHLQDCSECEQEYMQLIETRERLGEWEISESGQLPTPIAAAAPADQALPIRSRLGTLGAGSWVLRAAAALLMAVGALALLQRVGIHLPGETPVEVKRAALVEMAGDVFEDRILPERERQALFAQRVYEDLGTLRSARSDQELEDLKFWLAKLALRVDELESKQLPSQLERIRDR